MSLHLVIGINNQSNYSKVVDRIIQEFDLQSKHLYLYDKKHLDRFMDEEAIHDDTTFLQRYGQSLQSMSSGQQKIRFINYLLDQKPHSLILDNPLSHLDPENQKELIHLLEIRQNEVNLIFILNRSDWIPEYCSAFYNAFDTQFKSVSSRENFQKLYEIEEQSFNLTPILKHHTDTVEEVLVDMKNITICYGDKKVLNDVHWTIKSGEFWELRGPNGSGKTTLLTMITGENPKAYGQDIHLFGFKKGSGESVWDIKKHIGYFTPSMTGFFKGYFTVKEMIIGGIKDSVGLYIKPSKLEEQLVSYWIDILGMRDKKDTYFVNLSIGEQCLVMTARAMVKNPKLLILDEPTAGLDQQSNELFMKLVNTIAKQHQTAIIYVSHKREVKLTADFVMELIPKSDGSTYQLL